MERLLLHGRPLLIALRVLVVVGLAGCSNQQMSASNPFMSPDRVPPPATRTIAPGTAAPYYPGDPIPAAQVAPPGAPLVAQAPPGAVPPGSPPMVAPVAAMAAPVAVQANGFTNERTVAIPADNENLRFSVPPPPTDPQAPMVVPAAFNQPIASQPAPAAGLVPSAAVPSATVDNDTSGPWRSPAVPNANSPVMQAQYVQTPAGQPAMLGAQPPLSTAPQMPVELRAVPAPPTTQAMTAAAPQAMPPVAPAMTPPPRMRFPTLTDPSTWFTPQPAAAAGPPPGQQLVGYMVPGPNGEMQMVSVEQMQAMNGGAAPPAAEVASSDGFRPRGSATK